MNYRTKNKLIQAICKGQTLYIRDTGIAVRVDYFGSDLREDFRGRNRRIEHPCNIEFLTPPTTKALKLFNKWHIKRNSHSGKMELDGTINLEHLSLKPFETKAAKVLYDKVKD